MVLKHSMVNRKVAGSTPCHRRFSFSLTYLGGCAEGAQEGHSA